MKVTGQASITSGRVERAGRSGGQSLLVDVGCETAVVTERVRRFAVALLGDENRIVGVDVAATVRAVDHGKGTGSTDKSLWHRTTYVTSAETNR